MKKIFFLFLFVISISYANVPKAIDDNIRTWIKKTYNIDQYGSSLQKIMYEEEIKNYSWLQRYATDEVTLNRVMKMYPVNQYGYSLIKIMYEEETKNNNW